MTAEHENRITSLPEYIEAVIICWAASNKPNFRAYYKGFTDAHLGSGLITPEFALEVRNHLFQFDTRNI